MPIFWLMAISMPSPVCHGQLRPGRQGVKPWANSIDDGYSLASDLMTHLAYAIDKCALFLVGSCMRRCRVLLADSSWGTVCKDKKG